MIIRNGSFVGDSHIVLNVINDNIDEARINFLKNRYSLNRAISIVYVDFPIEKFIMDEFSYIYHLEFKLINLLQMNSIKQILDKAQANLKQIIENYTYQSLYMGGINDLTHMFCLPHLKQLSYLQITSTQVLHIKWGGSKKFFTRFIAINTKNDLIEELKKVILKLLPDHIFHVIIIKVCFEIKEDLILSIFKNFTLPINLILIKDIPYSKEILLRLDSRYSYNIDSIIVKPSIHKLVNLLKDKLPTS